MSIKIRKGRSSQQVREDAPIEVGKHVKSEKVPFKHTSYFVTINKGMGELQIACVGMGCVDSAVEGTYASFEELPKWLADKVFILQAACWGSNQSFAGKVDGVGLKLQTNNGFEVYHIEG